MDEGFWQLAIIGGLAWWGWSYYQMPIHGKYVLVAEKTGVQDYTENPSQHTEMDIGYSSITKTVKYPDGCVMIFIYSELKRIGDKIEVSHSFDKTTSQCGLGSTYGHEMKLDKPYEFYYRTDGGYLYLTFPQVSQTERYQAL